MSNDYAPASWRPEQVGSNFTPANRPASSTISRVSLHYTAGESFPVIFGGPVSSHYGIARDGRVDQYVREKDVAWADGAWESNLASLSIEHQGWGNPADWTQAMIDASARLVGGWCRKYGIPADREHILAHSEINAGKSDPGPHFPWTRYMELVRKYAGGREAPSPKKPAAPLPAPGTLYVVEVPAQQVGAFKRESGAGHLGAGFEALGLKVMLVVEGGFTKVRLAAQQQGAYSRKAGADEVEARLKGMGASVKRSTKNAPTTPQTPPRPTTPKSTSATQPKSLVPAGHRDVAPIPNGTWLQRHPTRYGWQPRIEVLIRELYRRFDNIHINSYVDHPEGWGRKLKKNLDVLSFDVWAQAGRGVPIAEATGHAVVEFLMEEPSDNLIDWCIFRGRIWTRASGVWLPFSDDGTGPHDDHPHFSYV